jgi:hypothetical protein
MGQLLYDKASLVNIPSRYKDGKLYNIKPSNADFEFERGTGATRVNEDGLIERFYNEATNSLLQSNQFDTTWLNSNTTETGGQVGYDGSSDAWLITKSNSNGFIYQSVSNSGVQTVSVYAKKGTNNWMQIYAVGSTNVRAYYDLENGVLGDYQLNTTNRSIEDVGNGWYRCSVTFNSSLTSVRFFVSDGNNDDTGTSGSIYIQDAQLESGYFATPHIETTTEAVTRPNRHDTPRIDYTNGKALLLEPQRTNSILYSEYFSGWSTAVGTITITNNATTSPEGVDNATRIVSSSTGVRMRGGNVSVTSGEKWTYSIFAKKNTTDSFRMRHEVSANFAITFDLGDESFTGSGNWYDNAAIEDYGNGWYRCIVYLTADSTGNRSFEVDFQNNDDLYFYGAQVEQGSYATSYIPTNGGTETRNGEGLPFPSVYEFGDLGDGESGTLFIETEIRGLSSGGRFNLLSQGGSGTWFFQDTDNRLYIRTTTTSPSFDLGEPPTKGETYKIAIRKEASNDVSVFFNGQLKGTVNIGTNNLQWATHISTYQSSQAIKSVVEFGTALEDHELERLTSPTPLHASSFEDLANNNGYTIL